MADNPTVPKAPANAIQVALDNVPTRPRQDCIICSFIAPCAMSSSLLKTSKAAVSVGGMTMRTVRHNPIDWNLRGPVPIVCPIEDGDGGGESVVGRHVDVCK